MFHVERMVVCRAAAPLVLVLALGACRLRAAFWGTVLGLCGSGEGRLVWMLVAWSLCVGWVLLALSVPLVDVIDATQHVARRPRYSWSLVSPREVAARPRSAEVYPSAL